MEHLNILTLHIAEKVFVRAQGFEIDEADAVVAGVPRQIELAQTAKLVDPQTGEVAFFFSPMSGFRAISTTAISTPIATLSWRLL